MKSLNLRESQVRRAVEHLRTLNTPKAEALMEKINQTRSVGFHNLSLALKLWAELSTHDSGDGVRVGAESFDAADK